MEAYVQAIKIVRENKAAPMLLRDSAHHTERCREVRASQQDQDVCYCDLPVHLAEIIREAQAA